MIQLIHYLVRLQSMICKFYYNIHAHHIYIHKHLYLDSLHLHLVLNYIRSNMNYIVEYNIVLLYLIDVHQYYLLLQRKQNFVNHIYLQHFVSVYSDDCLFLNTINAHTFAEMLTVLFDLYKPCD